jgi:hypothetical protein
MHDAVTILPSATRSKNLDGKPSLDDEVNDTR